MTPRKFFFWMHLCFGSLAGIVILIMSLTGILMAFERQINNFADRGFRHSPATAGAARLPVETLLSRLSDSMPGARPTALTVLADAESPAAAEFGRDRIVYINPYTGVILGDAPQSTRAFFRQVERWHRWLATPGGSAGLGRTVTGIANFLFLLLVCSGFYLWWPKKWTWRQVRPAMWFRIGLKGKAQNWNWHNTIGFWCAVPLFIVTLTGVVMSLAWANALVYRMTGNAVPPKKAGRDGGGQSAGRGTGKPIATEGLNALWILAERQVPSWQSISLHLPAGRSVVFAIDEGNGGRPDLRSTLTLDRKTGATVSWEPFQSLNNGRRLRSWIRFSHTGEAGGVIGQTIACIAALGGAMLVWTGLSMAVRRLLAWRARRDKAQTSNQPREAVASGLSVR